MKRDPIPERSPARSGSSNSQTRGQCFSTKLASLHISVQAKVLRVIEEQCFERIGGLETIRVNTRVDRGNKPRSEGTGCQARVSRRPVSSGCPSYQFISRHCEIGFPTCVRWRSFSWTSFRESYIGRDCSLARSLAGARRIFLAGKRSRTSEHDRTDDHTSRG